MTEMWAVTLVLIAQVFGSFGAIYLKLGSKNSLSPFRIYKNFKLVFGILLYGISTIIFIPALRGGSLSVLYPLTSFSYILICILSQKMLNEKMNLFKWAGILTIAAGITLVGFSS